jgi:hypothetical protein
LMDVPADQFDKSRLNELGWKVDYLTHLSLVRLE